MSIPFSLLIVHWWADFVVQSTWMATNKGHKWRALIVHGVTYAPWFCWWGVEFVVLTGLLHMAVDAVTSRITSRLYHAGQRHAFFVVIGADQVIHYALLVWALQITGSGS